MKPLSNLFDPFFLALYAEIHYTLRGLISRLKRNQPEIIADVPFRLNPENLIPILCIVKDADRFPVRLESIQAEVEYASGEVQKDSFVLSPTWLNRRFWFKVFHIVPRRGYSGKVSINVRFQLSGSKRSFEVVNHNYKGSSNHPLEVYLSEEPLPTFEGWHYGEPHYHSSHTDDQVEFGAPVAEAVEMAKAMGLSWLAVTDHSFDIDDVYGDPMRKDPQLTKWNRLKEETTQVNHNNDHFVTVLGEEISCGNARSKNIHLLAYGIENFLPGAGDGMERWFQTRPDLPLSQVLKRIAEDGGVAYASHPEVKLSVGQRVFTGRGWWENEDYGQPGLSGLQFWNGADEKAFQRGYERWIQFLLKGKRLYFIGGNDAHGDFNRFRQIRIPLLMLRESRDQIFGKMRTCLYCPEPLTPEEIVEGLRKGRVVVTDGPLVVFTVEDEEGKQAMVGESMEGRRVALNIRAKSTAEFGDIERITIIRGDLREKREVIEKTIEGSELENPREAGGLNYPLKLKNPSYIRIEIASCQGQKTFHGYTNPIWVTH